MKRTKLLGHIQFSAMRLVLRDVYIQVSFSKVDLYGQLFTFLSCLQRKLCFLSLESRLFLRIITGFKSELYRYYV